MTLDVPVLACRELRYRYGDRLAVDGVSFDVLPGQAFGLLGPNGAGKTTAIKMLCGLLPPSSGEVFIAGHALDREPLEAKRCLGYVPQDLALYTELTARENLDFWGRLYGLRGRDLARRVDETLEVVSLQDRAKDVVKEFSGGMQRRLNLAVALLSEPALLVLDEPTVGVDPQSRNAIMDRLEDLRQSGVAILYASHYMEEVERLCDVVGVVDHGKVVAHGTPNELIASLGDSQTLRIQARGDIGTLVSKLYSMPEVTEAIIVDGAVQLTGDNAIALVGQVATVATEIGVEIEGIDVSAMNLEAVFLKLTGRTLRD